MKPVLPTDVQIQEMYQYVETAETYGGGSTLSSQRCSSQRPHSGYGVLLGIPAFPIIANLLLQM